MGQLFRFEFRKLFRQKSFLHLWLCVNRINSSDRSNIKDDLQFITGKYGSWRRNRKCF